MVCCIILTLGAKHVPYHNIAFQSHYQEAIQFKAAKNVIDQDYRLDSNHGPQSGFVG